MADSMTAALAHCVTCTLHKTVISVDLLDEEGFCLLSRISLCTRVKCLYACVQPGSFMLPKSFCEILQKPNSAPLSYF